MARKYQKGKNNKMYYQSTLKTFDNNKISYNLFSKLYGKNFYHKKQHNSQKRHFCYTSHVVYEVQCPPRDCALFNPPYIGQTRNEILTRMNQHWQNEAILQHLPTHHDIVTVSFDELSYNVKILEPVGVKTLHFSTSSL